MAMVKTWKKRKSLDTRIKVIYISTTMENLCHMDVFPFYEKCYNMVRCEEKLFLENFLFWTNFRLYRSYKTGTKIPL